MRHIRNSCGVLNLKIVLATIQFDYTWYGPWSLQNHSKLFKTLQMPDLYPRFKFSREILVHWETLTYRTGKDCRETGAAAGRGRVKGQDALQCFGQSVRECLPIWPPQSGRERGWCDWRRGGRWLGRARQRGGRKAGHANRHATTTWERWRRLEAKRGIGY